MSRHSEHKKAKKLAVLARNRRNHMLFEAMRVRQREAVRVEGLEVSRAEIAKRDDVKTEEVLWSARTQQIRNRLTGKKRMADERWNRFAGTSGGGGRGL